MGAMNPETEIDELPGVGPEKAAALEADGFETLADVQGAHGNRLIANDEVGDVIAARLKKWAREAHE